MPKVTAGEKVVTTATCSHCGGTCILKVHVKDGVVTRIETDDGPEPQLRACLRCRAYRQRLYDPGRVLHPMVRVGDRGEGKFERVSWDTALGKVASELKRVRDTYGPASILSLGLGGDSTIFNSYKGLDRLLCLLGGHTRTNGWISDVGALFASVATYGTIYCGNNRNDLLNSRLILMWSWDPATTIQSTGTGYHLAQAREKGIRMVTIDPRYTDSAAIFAQQWIPIRPGTDAAMAIAMAYVITSEKLQDQRFLDKYTVGFDKYRDYLTGKSDGVAKTPAWAEAITGVPAATIVSLAREYATSKPACLFSGIAAGRSAYGEQYHRATAALAAMTGNVGVHGGESGVRAYHEYAAMNHYQFSGLTSMKSGPNPVEAAAPKQRYALKNFPGFPSAARIHYSNLADAMIKGKSGGYFSDIKALYVMTNDPLNQMPNINKMVQALKKLEFIVVHAQCMTPTARYADVLLPSSTWMERNDITAGGGTPMFSYLKKLAEPQGESKSHIEILNALSRKLDLADYNDKSEEEWLHTITKDSGIPDYDGFMAKAIHKVPLSEPYVAFKEQIQHPERHPFPTPSGKIEIYSKELADMHHPGLPPLPTYIEPWEGPSDPLRKKYPLQLVTTHFKRRTHTQFDTVPWLVELMPQVVWIHTADAQARGIKDGDTVRVFNDRGQMVIRAKVTERIMPGVVDVPQGAWYNPDKNGVDYGGSANVLTRDEHSPGGAFASNTSLVQVSTM